jgi:DegV family protein with EDD domain
MTIKIVTDSTCDLPDAVITKYDLTVVPLYVNIGHRSYLNGVDLSSEEFYRQLSAGKEFPSTAAPGSKSFRQVYQMLAAGGATEILSIHVSGTLSATLNHARLGAQEIRSVPVTVFDSRQISLGVGFLVTTAAKAVATHQSVKDIIPLLEAQVLKTHLLGILDTLEFLRHSGRASRLLADLGSLLRIKPLFGMYNGEVTSERIRTRRRAIKRLVHLLENLAPFEQAALIHSHAPERTEELHRQIQPLLPEGEVLQVEIAPILGAHFGPGGVGVVCVTTN